MSSFCAFGFRSDSSPQLADWVTAVRVKAEAINYRILLDDFLVDREVSPGLLPFCERQKIDRLLYIDTEKRRKIGPNSQGVFNELAIADYADDTEIQLITLLSQATSAYPGVELYLFLAFEWKVRVYSRLITCEKSALLGFLRKYYSYCYTLFDCENGNYILDLDTPTIIRVT